MSVFILYFYTYTFLYFELLKMLGLFLYTLIIGHTYFNMLSILNKFTLQEKLHYFVTNTVFVQKSKNSTTAKQNIKHKTPFPEPGIKLRTSRTQSGCVISAPPSQLTVTMDSSTTVNHDHL